ncbi:unnamed protein product [Schistocephalus solidus]|uniref:PID domain-containing protein n=1 Tax=Schistocephalus solidus TaxID=70667 RepID=A0A0X3P2F4_SCHSO|nr:unnamed protein product [Schistocephalus solidus]
MPHDHKKAGKKSKPKEFRGKGNVEGKVPIPMEEEITIQGAREVLENRHKKNIGKSYDCKVIGTDTHLIIKRSAVVGSAPRELSFACTDILRFFIFARDPRLVILVVPEKPEGRRAYLLLKMHDDKQANQVCNVIQEGRKRLNQGAPPTSQETPPTPSQAENSLVAAAYKDSSALNLEMQEKAAVEEEEDAASTTSSEQNSEDEVRQTARSEPALFASPVSSKEDSRLEGAEKEKEGTDKPKKKAMSNEGLFAISEAPMSDSQNPDREALAITPVPAAAMPLREEKARKSSVVSPVLVAEQKARVPLSNQSPAQLESPSTPQLKEGFQPLVQSPVPFTQMDDYVEQQPPLKIMTPTTAVEGVKKAERKEKSHSVNSPRILPRQALETRRRMDAPVTEEMWYNYKGTPREPCMPQVRNLEELKRELLRDLYDEDWSVDVKIVETVGNFGSRISDQGSVFMFAAHHLVPEDYGRWDCQSSHAGDASSSSESSTSSSSSSSSRRHRHARKTTGRASMQYASSTSSDDETYRAQKIKLAPRHLVST